MNSWLTTCLDYGVSEFDFWNMTYGEVVRLVESKRRVQKVKEQEKASFDYILADLIGRSVSRIYSSSARMPDIGKVYPHLFDSEEIKRKKQEKQQELNILRFKQFTQNHNQKYKEVGNK